MKIARCLLIATLLAIGGWAGADPVDADAQSRTVIGPSNPALHDGAQRLLAGDAEEGIRLTKIGLAAAANGRERQAGLSNLCAGYVMLASYDTALGFCNEALEQNERNWRALCNRALIYVQLGRFDEAWADLDLGQEIAPRATALKEVRGMLLDATEPVTPNIVIDDRREAGRSDAD